MGDKTFLITGATGGIGRALCLRLAEAGCQLIVAGPNPRKVDQLASELEQAGSPPPLMYPVDQSGATAEDYDRMAAAIEQECGRLDGVVHLAAQFAGLTPLLQIGADTWQKTFNVNVHSAQWINQACRPLLHESEGTIVFALDDEAQISQAFWGAYGVSKGALNILASITREEVEAEGIKVIEWKPGPTLTRLRRSAFLEDPAQPRAAEDAAQNLAAILLS